MRVVSLTCSNTEITCALGAAESLVGVDNHSDYPVEVVSRLPRVGPDLTIDIAAVARLRPDLVLASLTVPGHERVIEGLERARLPYLAPEPRSIADVYADIRLIGAALDVGARAEELVAEMQAEIQPVDVAKRRRILVEWWPKPVIVPGRESWVTELIEAAGAVNPLGERRVKSAPITDADALALDPEAIVISWCGVRAEKYHPHVVYRRAAWQELPALKNRRVYGVPEAYLGRPGPRLVEGYRALRRIVTELD